MHFPLRRWNTVHCWWRQLQKWLHWDVLGIPAPLLVLELQCIGIQRTTHWGSSFSVPHAPLHPQWRLSFCVPWYGNHFPSNLSYLFCLVWPPRGSEAHRETDCTDCAELQKPGPVSHGGAFSPSDVSWPFPWGSQAAHSASVNTGPSVSFSVTRLSLFKTERWIALSVCDVLTVGGLDVMNSLWIKQIRCLIMRVLNC